MVSAGSSLVRKILLNDTPRAGTTVMDVYARGVDGNRRHVSVLDKNPFVDKLTVS